MANKPTTYDDITRETVPNPDGSMRPTREQVERAYDGTHTRTHDDQQLLAQVEAVLRTHADANRVQLEVRDGRVDLRGSVGAPGSLRDLEELVRDVPGVTEVDNKLVVG